VAIEILGAAEGRLNVLPAASAAGCARRMTALPAGGERGACGRPAGRRSTAATAVTG
jgi:hypothetical protein